MSKRCIKALVSGRVQGVFFRDSTRRQARLLQISGHAINLADGRVEVLACGNHDDVESLIRWLHQGPTHASVNRVEIIDLEPSSLTGFTIG
jgi:acylphosphatase